LAVLRLMTSSNFVGCTGHRGQQEAAAVHLGMVGRAANQVKCVARQERRRPRASSSISAAMVILVRSPGHARPAVERDPGHQPIDASVKVAAAALLGEEAVQLGQQAHRVL
jgi:hypothetical protein